MNPDRGLLPPNERAVHKSATIPASAEDIYWAWTTDAGIRTWLLDDSRIELRVGGRYEWYFDTDQLEGLRGSEGCQVIGFQAPTMLTFTWNAPPSLSEARAQRTVVLLRLRPVDEGDETTVELTHLGWGSGGEWDAAFDYFDDAWDRVLDRLVAHFDAADHHDLP